LEEDEVKLAYNSVRGYISALKRLYEEQRKVQHNTAPEPVQLGVKCLKRALLRSKWARDRQNLVDRGEGTIKDSYMPSQIPDHTRAAWQWNENWACGFRTNLDFLFGNHMLLRSSNRLPLELADCCTMELLNEGLFQDQGQARQRTRILVLVLNYGKTNQHGNKQYAGAMRHRDPLSCAVSQLAFWLFWRWHCEREPFPCMRSSYEWYNIKLIRRSLKENMGKLHYNTANDWTNRLYAKAGISGPKTTHLPRQAGAQHADMQGVSIEEVSHDRGLSTTLHPNLPTSTNHGDIYTIR
jgi:hypothetical protein